MYVIIFLIGITCLIYYKEVTDRYTFDIPKTGDNINVLYSKLKKASTFNLHTIKWRQTFISSTLILLMTFSIVHLRLPTYSEITITFFCSYIVIYNMQQLYTDKISKPASKIVNKCIRAIKQKHFYLSTS